MSGEADGSGALVGFACFLLHRRRVAHRLVRKRRYAAITGGKRRYSVDVAVE
jgi:hypothetical protein